MQKSISILGCGWLGLPLAASLIDNGYKIKGSTTSKEKFALLNSKKIEPYIINLNTIEYNLDKFLDSEILIIATPSKNVKGFQKLISNIEKSEIIKVVLISSTSVYKNSENLIAENAPLIDSPLVEIENLFKNNSKFATTILRFGGLISYDRNPGFFFPEGKIIQNPNGFVNMIHRDDCISVIEQIIKNNIWDETLNACAETHPTRREFYTKAALASGRALPKFNENRMKETKVINSNKLKELLEIQFRFPNLLEFLSL